MNNNVRKTIIGVALVSIIIIFVVAMIINKNKVYTSPDYEPIATIYHSQMLGEDAGTEFIYDIYKSDKKHNEYFYIKSKSYITINGPDEKTEVKITSVFLCIKIQKSADISSIWNRKRGIF